MATRISDVVVPEIFTPYVQQQTEEKSRLIQSGALVSDDSLSELLAGGGVTFNSPSFQDLDNSDENVSSDDPNTDSSPGKIQTSQEIQVRLSRNNSWSSMALTAALAGADPMDAIAGRVSNYWALRLQAAFVATMKGIFADNDAAPSGTEHTQYDLTNDISGDTFSDGVTNFSTAAFIDAAVTMGDSMEDLGMVMVHSVVYARMLKNNLIDFVPDSTNPDAARIPTFLGRQVITDDTVPANSGVFETWLFGSGAVRLGNTPPPDATETGRSPSAGNGAGQETLYSRIQWAIHPTGHKYAGSAPNGGPSNEATTNNLADAASWERVFPERKQIKIARLVTREY